LIPLCSPQQAKTPTTLALGSFDGLHAGHRRVIESVTKADHFHAIPTVVSFWPHPREVLHGEPRLRLDLPEEKLELLEPLGIQQLVLVPFNRQLAQLSAAEFVEQVLLSCLKARQIAVGANFRFGRGREGDTNTLRALAEAAGVQVSVLPILEDAGGRMSSSRIREALTNGDLQAASSLLGRPYRFRGTVVRGRGLGRELGWPTANLQVDGRKFLPGLGVYAARAWTQGDGEGRNSEALPAVMNLGPQPTVDPNSPSAVEVHLLDRRIELVGQELVVEPVERLRGQQRFSGLEELSAQIGKDAEAARQRLQATAG
jgi:riboflavin kinase/FMN adenylyltransferase